MPEIWLSLSPNSDSRRKLALFVIVAITAVLVGFVLVPADVGGRLIMHAGYYYILGVFSLWLYYAWRVTTVTRLKPSDWIRSHWKVIAFLGTATAFAVWTDNF